MRPLVVAMDGPSGSGKSSVCRAVARKLRLAYLDTGAMYRAATWWCLEQRLDLTDEVAVSAAVREMDLQVGLDPDSPTVRVSGHAVDVAIRQSRVSEAVSMVAVNLDARTDLIGRQRRIIADECVPGGYSGGNGIVVEGRDITTVVAPDADARVLLTAREDVRLHRRTTELHGTANAATLARTRDQVLLRDERDSTVVEFRTAADGVVTVDSSDLDLHQTVDAVLQAIQERSA
jgi:CMP/dCMP kinase